MPRPIRLAAPLRQQPIGTVALLRKYNGGLDVAPPPHGSCFLLFLVWWHYWCFRLSLLRIRRPWPGPCTRAGAGAGPQAAARTTPPPHFKGKTMKNCQPGAEQRGSPVARRDPRQPGAEQRGLPVARRDPRQPGAEQRGLPVARRDPRQPGAEQRGSPGARRDPRQSGAEQRGSPGARRDPRQSGAEQHGSPGDRRDPRQPGAEGRGSPRARAGRPPSMAPKPTACPLGAQWAATKKKRWRIFLQRF